MEPLKISVEFFGPCLNFNINFFVYNSHRHSNLQNSVELVKFHKNEFLAIFNNFIKFLPVSSCQISQQCIQRGTSD